MLRKALKELEPEDIHSISRTLRIHSERKRTNARQTFGELAVTVVGLQHNDPHTMKYLGHEIKILCKAVLRDCGIEMANSMMDFNLQLLRELRISSCDRQTNIWRGCQEIQANAIIFLMISITGNFLMIVPQLVQAVKEVFQDERIHKRKVD
ncbi:hypothetical protein OS493_006442 [Desmophyllum pertusum]|uniref:Uncharacterized protein n=1 Tax=Desmophyllum pertusum TaxID=174260 RepID=A0A9X0DC87_9CNID|nr:hypothetical protein OS493_006442 [Desmophyllum pertusum]